MRSVALAISVVLATIGPSAAAQLLKSYSYFSIRGNTLDDIEKELSRRGPNVGKSGKRHPAATRMEFKTRITYQNHGSHCVVSAATVRIAAKVILPKWRAGRQASSDTRFVWGSLSADMKRHEESHVGIANNYARELENALRGIGRQKTCKTAADRAAKLTKTILDKHDREQVRFDRIESAGFERRLLKLMENRLRRMRQG